MLSKPYIGLLHVKCRYCLTWLKLEISEIFEKYSKPNFMKIRQAGAELSNADGRTYRQTLRIQHSLVAILRTRLWKKNLDYWRQRISWIRNSISGLKFKSYWHTIQWRFVNSVHVSEDRTAVMCSVRQSKKRHSKPFDSADARPTLQRRSSVASQMFTTDEVNRFWRQAAFVCRTTTTMSTWTRQSERDVGASWIWRIWTCSTSSGTVKWHFSTSLINTTVTTSLFYAVEYTVVSTESVHIKQSSTTNSSVS
jgi:hypothetical protein